MARVSRYEEIKNNNDCKMAIYVRLSTQDDEYKNSIDSQLSLIDNYLNKMQDIKGTVEYIDNGFTGTNFNRPQFNKMLDDIKDKKINAIIVKDFSRFGRDHLTLGNYLEKLFPFLGIRFISINDNYDSLDNQSEGMLEMILKNITNEMYSKDLSSKIKAALDVKRAKGEFLGRNAPFGFFVNSEKILEKNNDVNSVIDLIINETLFESQSFADIARKLNNEGYLAPYAYAIEKGFIKSKQKVGENWSGDTVSSVLKILVKTKDKYNIEHNDHIESLRIFLNESRKKRKTSRTGKAVVNPLQGIIYCACCNRSVKMNTSGRQRMSTYYYCRYCRYNYRINEPDRPKMLSGQDLLEVLEKQIQIHLMSLQEDISIIESNQDGDKLKEAERSLYECQENIDTLENKKIILYEDLINELFQREDYIFFLDSMNKDIEKLLIQARKIEQTIKDINLSLLAEKKLYLLLENRERETYNQKWIKEFVDKIYLDLDNNISIQFKYPDEIEYIQYLKGAVICE